MRNFLAQCERVRMVCYVRLVCGTFLLACRYVAVLLGTAQRNFAKRHIMVGPRLGRAFFDDAFMFPRSAAARQPWRRGRVALDNNSTRSESFFDLITKLRVGLRLEFCRYAGVGGADASPSNR